MRFDDDENPQCVAGSLLYLFLDSWNKNNPYVMGTHNKCRYFKYALYIVYCKVYLA